MRVVALFRVSTERQANEGASLDAQQRSFESLALINNWTVCATCRGCESASGAAHERHVLQQALAAIREHEAEAVWVYEQSRLTRGDELEVALLTRELRERGCKIIIGSNVRDFDSLDDRFALRIQAVVDRAESERIVERTGRGRREKARQGRWNCASPPYGFSNPPKGHPDRGVLQIVPDQAAIVREIFQRYDAGESISGLSRRFTDMGIPSPRNGRWGTSAIRRVLTNPAYVGTIVFGRWDHADGTVVEREPSITVEQAHTAIVTRDLWDRVQQRLKGRARRGVAPAMLTGLLHVNGQAMHADCSAERLYYRSAQPKGAGCWMNRTQLDELVWDRFLAFATDAGTMAAATEALCVEDRQSVRQMVDVHRAAITRLERRLDGWKMMRADGEITKAEYEQRAASTRRQLAAAREALSQCVEPDSDPEIIEQLAMVSSAVRHCQEPAGRRRLMELLIDRIEVDAERTGRKWQPRGMSFLIGVSSLQAPSSACRMWP